MKVLQLTKHYPPVLGGVESVTYDLTEGLKALNVSCDVMCANITSKTLVTYVNGYKVWRVSRWANLKSTSICPGLPYLLKKNGKKYEIIHVHFPDPMTALSLYLARPDAKIIVHWHSDIIKQKQLLKYFRPLQDWVLRRAHLIIGTSPKYIEESNQLSGFRHKAVAVPIGINMNRIIFNDEVTARIKQQYGNRRIIFSLGRLVYYKGFEYLIEAAKYLPDDTIILIGGEGPLRKELENTINRLGLIDKVVLVGKIPENELGSFFFVSHLFCLPSVEKSEAFGVVQLEAMAMGKPVIATNIEGSGVDWVNEDGVSGFNVPIKNSKALAERINLLLSNKELYDEISRKSKERFEQNFTARKMTESVYAHYQRLLQIE